MTDFNERQLEELLQTSLTETSLVENLTGINPFGAAIDKIIAGMVTGAAVTTVCYLVFLA